MTPRTLATALLHLARRTPEHEWNAIFARMETYLTVHGRGNSLPTVLHEALVLAKRESEKRAGELIVSRGEDVESVHDRARMYLRELGAEGEPRTRIDPSLVTGFIASYGSQRYDASGKWGLVSLYRHLLTRATQ